MQGSFILILCLSLSVILINGKGGSTDLSPQKYCQRLLVTGPRHSYRSANYNWISTTFDASTLTLQIIDNSTTPNPITTCSYTFSKLAVGSGIKLNSHSCSVTQGTPSSYSLQIQSYFENSDHLSPSCGYYTSSTTNMRVNWYFAKSVDTTIDYRLVGGGPYANP